MVEIWEGRYGRTHEFGESSEEGCGRSIDLMRAGALWAMGIHGGRGVWIT